MRFLSSLFNEKNKKSRAKAFRRLARLWGGGGYDPIGPPRSTDKYMEDLENSTPFCRLAARLKLTVREATFLMQMFEDMDHDGRGLLTGDDVYAYFRVDAPAVAKECLQATTLLRREKLEYHEMLMTVYNFCTLPPNRIGDYVFQVLDEMGAGSIERDVVLENIPRIHEKAAAEELEVMTRRVRKTIATTRTGTVTLEDWRRVQKRNPTLLVPINAAQRHLQAQCMGPRFWMDKSEERFRIFQDVETPGVVISDMLEVVVNKREIDLGPLSPERPEERDPREADFETPRQEKAEEAYRQEMAELIHEKHRLEEKKKTALQKSKEEAARLKGNAKKVTEEVKRLKEEAEKRLKAEAQRLEEAATQAAVNAAARLKTVAGSFEDLRPEGQEEEWQEGQEEEEEAAEQEEEEEEEEEEAPIRCGDWWTLDEPEGEKVLKVEDDVADVMRLYYARRAEGRALLERVAETQALNIGKEKGEPRNE